MDRGKYWLSGILLLVVLTSSFYFIFDDSVKVDMLAATEYVYIYDGTTKMRASSRELIYWNDSEYAYVQRLSTWKDNITTKQTYIFDIYNKDITQYPLRNKFECINCEGKFIQFEIRDILYDGETKNIKSPFNFGNNMKIEWQPNDDFSWAKVYQNSVASDKIIVKFKADEQFEEYNVRLFDPPITENLVIYAGENITLGGTHMYNTVYLEGEIYIDEDYGYLELISNSISITGDGKIYGIDMFSGGASVYCSSSNEVIQGIAGEGYSAGGGGLSSYSTWFTYATGAGGAGSNMTGQDGGSLSGPFNIVKKGGAGGLKSVSNNIDRTYSYGAGGGSGSCSTDDGDTATTGIGGNGSAGLSLFAETINIQGSIYMNGDSGTDASISGTNALASGGAGGSGGDIVISANEVTILNSYMDVRGGAAGISEGTWAMGTSSSGLGSGGKIKIFYDSSISISSSSIYYTGIGLNGLYIEVNSSYIPIEIITPTNNSNYAAPLIIEANVTGTSSVLNLVIDGVINKTYSNRIIGDNIFEELYLSSGSHNISFNGSLSSGHTFQTDTIYYVMDSSPPIVNLITPDDGYISDTISNNFTINISYVAADVKNISLIMNINTKQTYTPGSASSNTVHTFLEDINYVNEYYFRYCNSFDVCYNGDNRTIFLDVTSPTIEIEYPLDINYITNVSIANISVIDSNIDYCWASKDNGITNISISNDTFSSGEVEGTLYDSLNIISTLSDNHLIIYCNDTRGNIDYVSTNYYLDAIRYNINSSVTDTNYSDAGVSEVDIYDDTYIGDCSNYGSSCDDKANFNDDGSTYFYGNPAGSDFGYISINLGDLRSFNSMNLSFNTGDYYEKIEMDSSCLTNDSIMVFLFGSMAVGDIQWMCSNTSNSSINVGHSDIKFYNYSVLGIRNNNLITQVVDINPLVEFKNITYNYYNITNGEIILNYNDSFQTNMTNNIYSFNSSIIPIYWNTILYDVDNVIYSLPILHKGIDIIDMNISNINVELGSSIIINATNNISNIYIDINHPDYGINYVSGFLSANTEVVINYFRKILFSNGNSYITFLNGGQLNNTLNITSHQYDEIDSLSFNITGGNFEGYPEDLIIYKSNSSGIDRIFPGLLIDNIIYQNKFSDDTSNNSIYFTSLAPQIVKFFIDDGATKMNLILDIYGYIFGFEYYYNFNESNSLDEILTTGMIMGGFGLPKGDNLKSFIYDEFLTSSNLNSSLWESLPNDRYYVCNNEISDSHCDIGDEFYFDVNNYYSNNGMIMDSILSESARDTNISYATANNYAYVNYTKFNIWTTQEINISIYYFNSGDESKSKKKCGFNSELYIGTKEVWSSPFQYCEDTYDSSCHEYSRSLDDFGIHMVRNENNSWTATFYGAEEAYGDDIDDGDCGWYSYVYNYTNNSLSKTYENPHDEEPNCAYYDSVEYTPNVRIISNLEWNTNEQFKFNQYSNGRYDNGDADGCSDIELIMNITLLNHSMYNMSNGTITSSLVFESDSDIQAATLNVNSTQLQGNSIINYLSSDDGDNFEVVTPGTEHSFSNIGTNLRYKYDINLNVSGYITNSPFIANMSIINPSGYPSNISFDFGDDGTIDASLVGEINFTNSPTKIEISSAITPSFFDRYSEYDHLYEIPLKIYSDSTGELFINNINITYNPNPIVLNIQSIYNFILNSIGKIDFPIKIGSLNGNITINDLKFDYAGGNDTIEILAHNADYSINDTLNITYYYSRWDYEWVPNGVEWIYFAPNTPTSENVTPYGQTDTVPILNITNYGYGGLDAKLSIYQDGLSECVNTTISLTPNKEDGVLLNESWVYLSDMSYLETQDIYLWSDYLCDYSTWTLFQPQYYFRQCVDGGACSTEII